MAVMPRSLGLVAALAVSGTTLYLVFGYNKKKAFENIEGGKGSWIQRGDELRRESALCLHGGSDIPPKKQQPVAIKESEVCVGLSEGEDIGIERVQWHQLRWFRKAIRRLPHQQQQLVLLPLTAPEAEQVSHGSGKGSQKTEQPLKDRLENCEEDAAQLNCFRDTGNHLQQQQRNEHVTNFAIVVSSTSNVSQSEFQERWESVDNNSAVLSSSSSNDCSIQKGPVADSCSEHDFSSKASLSSAVSSPSSQRLHSLVGCRIIPGSGKTPGKPKKVVRFSPSVAEPSSNNQAYRSRFNKTETTQRTTLQVEQRAHVPSSNPAVRSIAYDKSRQTLAYSVHRYRGRSFY